jgi:hypothetical protein
MLYSRTLALIYFNEDSISMNKHTGKTMWTIILWVTNILVLTILIRRTFEIDNDKAPVLFMFYYGIILLVNLALWLSFSFADKSVRTDFKRIFLTLLAAFIPLLTLVITYG